MVPMRSRISSQRFTAPDGPSKDSRVTERIGHRVAAAKPHDMIWQAHHGARLSPLPSVRRSQRRPIRYANDGGRDAVVSRIKSYLLSLTTELTFSTSKSVSIRILNTNSFFCPNNSLQDPPSLSPPVPFLLTTPIFSRSVTTAPTSCSLPSSPRATGTTSPFRLTGTI